jgi:hypothetical protein
MYGFFSKACYRIFVLFTQVIISSRFRACGYGDRQLEMTLSVDVNLILESLVHLYSWLVVLLHPHTKGKTIDAGTLGLVDRRKKEADGLCHICYLSLSRLLCLFSSSLLPR